MSHDDTSRTREAESGEECVCACWDGGGGGEVKKSEWLAGRRRLLGEFDNCHRNLRGRAENYDLRRADFDSLLDLTSTRAPPKMSF